MDLMGNGKSTHTDTHLTSRRMPKNDFMVKLINNFVIQSKGQFNANL